MGSVLAQLATDGRRRHARTARSNPRAWTTRPATSRHSRTAGHSRATGLTRRTGTRRQARVDELPLVVFRAPSVNANRVFLARARDANQPAAAARRARPRRALACGLASLARLARLPRLPWLPLLARLARALEGGGSGIYQAEILPGDRVLVLLAEEFLLNEDVDIRRICAEFPHVQVDRVDVLLTAKGQLRLLLPPHFVAPDRQNGRHEDGHDGEHRQESGHGVAGVAGRPGAKGQRRNPG